MRRLLFIFSLFFCICSTVQAQVLFKPDEAFAQSKQTGKPIMLVFSGSDWCVPCIQFSKRILNDNSFLSFAHNNLILLEADFPQRKKIETTLKAQYDSLAEKFNPNGDFPKIVLINKDGGLMGELTYSQQTSSEFIAAIKQKLPLQ